LFLPSAMVEAEMAGGSSFARLGFLKVRVRTRLTTDGGKSVLAAYKARDERRDISQDRSASLAHPIFKLSASQFREI
jgi:hypothetical protein